MKFELVRFGDHFRLVKGASYSSKNLVEESDTGLMTINAFHAGGGYKPKSEKPFQGEVRTEHMLANGDVLIAMTEQDEGLLGSPLVVHKARTDYEELLFSLDVAKLIATTGEIEPEFVFNVLRIPAFRKRAAYGDTGSTVQRLPYDAIGDFKMPKPPLPTQRAINRLAAAVDKKIWLNNRMAETLTQLSDSVFKSWFIDFDPVKAKMAGEAPVGMDSETAALFPDSMEESELGEMPTGWQIQDLDCWAQIISGGTPKTSTDSFWNGNIPWFSVADAPSEGGVFFVKTAKRISEDGLKYSAANLVRPGVAILSARGTVGKVAMVAKPSTFNQSCFGIEGKWGDAFNYLMVKSQVARLQGLAHGGMFDTITRETFKSLVFPFAGPKILEAFNYVADPIFELIRNLQFQNETLGTLRDSLLPRLISGELEIPDEMLAEL